MSRTFYPSDEYDSEELEQAAKSAKRRLRRLFKRSYFDDDDDPPMSPAGGSRPRPIAPLDEGAVAA